MYMLDMHQMQGHICVVVDYKNSKDLTRRSNFENPNVIEPLWDELEQA